MKPRAGLLPPSKGGQVSDYTPPSPEFAFVFDTNPCTNNVPFQTNRGFAREVRCFQGFELAENGSQEDFGTGPTFAGWKQRNR